MKERARLFFLHHARKLLHQFRDLGVILVLIDSGWIGDDFHEDRAHLRVLHYAHDVGISEQLADVGHASGEPFSGAHAARESGGERVRSSLLLMILVVLLLLSSVVIEVILVMVVVVVVVVLVLLFHGFSFLDLLVLLDGVFPGFELLPCGFQGLV